MNEDLTMSELAFFWEELSNKLNEIKVKDKCILSGIEFVRAAEGEDERYLFISYNDTLVAKYTSTEHTAVIDTYGYSNTNIRTKGYVLLINSKLNENNKKGVLKLIGDIITLISTIIFYKDNGLELGELEITEPDYSFDSGH